MIRLCISLLLLMPLAGMAQLKVDTFQTTDHLVRNVLLGKGVEVQNIKFDGGHGSMGLFVNDSTRLPFRKGIVLTTGLVHDAPGPNRSPGTSGAYATFGSALLSELAGGKTWDAARLDFDFRPTDNFLSFNFVFASEEYTEYVGSNFNDVFAFLISGPGIEGERNIAVIPGTTKPVTVNNINPNSYPELYIDNNLWEDDNSPIAGRIEELKSKEQPYLIGYDGFTTVLTAQTELQAGQLYHIRIEIADVGDFTFDSAVFLEANSFTSRKTPGSHTPEPPEHTDEPDKPQMPEREPSNLIYFDYDSDKITKSEQEKLKELLPYLRKSDHIELEGHTDSRGSHPYNLNLGQARAVSVMKFLVAQGIDEKKITLSSRSEDRPLLPNDSAKNRATNRRVEISF